MSKFVLFLAAAVAGLGCARAEPKTTVPITLVGEWCFSYQDGATIDYTLPSWTEDGHCTKILSIEPWGFYGQGQNCEVLRTTLRKDTAPSGTAYLATVVAQCSADGAARPGAVQTFKFERYKGNLRFTPG